MRANVLTVLLTALLIGSGAAAAQSGPDPGYPTAADYAQAYVASQAGNASGDPVTYAEGKASAEALQAEVNHTLYMVCWAADDQDIQHDACEPYYTPRGEAQPEQPIEEMPPVANDTLNATTEYLQNVTQEVDTVLDDPSQAPSAAKRILNATVGFFGAIAGTVVAIVDDVLDATGDLLMALGGIAGGLVTMGSGASATILAGLSGLLDALQLGSEKTAMAISTVGQALATGFTAIGGGIVTVFGAIGDGLEAVGGAIHTAADAAGDAVATAAGAVGEAIVTAYDTVTDAIKGLLGDDKGSSGAPVDLPVKDAPDADGLLDTVTGLLE